MNTTAISHELSKARATKVPFISISAGIAIAVLATFSLWAGSGDSTYRTYPAVLLSSAFFSALIWPIIGAVIASRLADIEFSNRGWLFMVTSGSSVRTLLSAKALVGARALALGVLTQSLITALICTLVHVNQAIPGPWALYFCCMWATTTVFFLAALLLACAAESQLATLIFGISSAFICVFAFLLPTHFFRFTPFGYYALPLPFTQSEGSITATEVHYLPFFIFLLISAILWQVGSRQLKIWS